MNPNEAPAGFDDDETRLPATGLSHADVSELLQLGGAITTAKILSIDSVGSDCAEVTTGYVANPEVGEGCWFECVRTKDGWANAKQGEWIN